MSSPMTPGFAEPVLGAQSSFRAMLHALSHPGRIVELPDVPQAPAPLGPAMAALALALCDADTPLWHDGGAAVTDCLSGDLGRDYSVLWAQISEFVDLPSDLPYGAPLVPHAMA